MSSTRLRAPALTRWLALALALLCTACAHTGAAAPTVILAGSVCSELPQLRAASTSQSQARSRDAEALVAYVADEPASKLVVYDLRAGRVRFEVPGALQSRPQLLADVVIAVDDQHRLVAYDLRSGEQRAAYALPRSSWLGAVQVGSQLIFTSTSLSFRPSERGSTVTALDTRSGARLWERNVPYALSEPSTAAGRIFVISDHADVWALHPESGDDIGCARLGSEPVDWLQPLGDKLVLGTHAARVVQLTGAVPRDGGRLQLETADLPGQPLLRPSAYQSVPAKRSAHGRVGVVANLEADGQAPALVGGVYFYTFYRHLFAFASDGALRWARRLDADAVRLRAAGEELIVLSESGELSWLRAQDGVMVGRLQLPDRLTSADLTAGRPPASAVRAAGSAPPLAEQLRALALDVDARLLPSRRLAVTMLAALPAPEATRDLLQVYVQPSAPAELKRHVARVLAQRTQGSAYLVEALGGDYNFLSGEPAPPLAAIVPGLVTNHEVRTVPRLVDRLFDPDTRLSELNLLVEAIAKLAGSEAHKPLAEFFALYHADSSLQGDASSLLSAARVLWTGESAAEVAIVEAAAKDPSTLSAVKDGLTPLMATALPSARAEVAAQPEQPAPEAPAALPERLSDTAITSVFASHAAELRECVAAELARNAGLRALRFGLVIERSGSISRFFVWPQRSELRDCLRPKLDELRFPAFARGRRLANYTLRFGQPGPSEQAPMHEGGKPFWFTAQLRGVGAPSVSDRTPWWQNQNPLYVSVEEPTQPVRAASSDPDRAAPAAAADPGSKPRQPSPTAEDPTTDDKAVPSDQWWLPGTSP